MVGGVDGGFSADWRVSVCAVVVFRCRSVVEVVEENKKKVKVKCAAGSSESWL
jgi:hypothetical protein